MIHTAVAQFLVVTTLLKDGSEKEEAVRIFQK
jgi:hypothetical protein